MALTFDLWAWPFAWSSLSSMMITPDNFMISCEAHCEKGLADRRTERRADRSVLIAAWSQLKFFRVMLHRSYISFRCEASLHFRTYFGQCPNDTYILLHFPLYVCSNYPHTGLTTATAPSGHQMAVVTCDRSIVLNVWAHWYESGSLVMIHFVFAEM